MKIPVLKIEQFQKPEPLNEFYINSFNDHIKSNNELLEKPHSHNFYLCVIFNKGTGTHEIDFNSYTIKPGKIFFLKPGQTHFWKFESEPEGYIFFHTQEFYELTFSEHKLNSFPFFYSYQNPPVLEVDKKKLQEYVKTFQEIEVEYKQNELFKDLKIKNLVNSIYIESTREYTAKSEYKKIISSNNIRILEGLESLINKNFHEEKFPKFYANELNISTKHLNRIVKETINETTSQLISERIILEAKRLIVHSNSNLANVANSLGFSDYSYFSKFFKSKTGVTPMNFRKKYY